MSALPMPSVSGRITIVTATPEPPQHRPAQQQLKQ